MPEQRGRRFAMTFQVSLLDNPQLAWDILHQNGSVTYHRAMIIDVDESGLTVQNREAIHLDEDLRLESKEVPFVECSDYDNNTQFLQVVIRNEKFLGSHTSLASHRHYNFFTFLIVNLEFKNKQIV